MSTEIETKKLFEMEKDVVEKLNTFYKAYSDYLRCISCNMDASKTTCDRSACTSVNGKDGPILAKFDDSFEALNVSMTNFRNEIEIHKTNKGGLNTKEYVAVHDFLISKHQEILQLRAELDNKLEFLNNASKAYPEYYKQRNETTVYAGILWSLLATTILYYVFIKL